MPAPRVHDDPRDIFADAQTWFEEDEGDYEPCGCSNCRSGVFWDFVVPYCSCEVCRAVACITDGEQQHMGHGALRFSPFTEKRLTNVD